MKRLTLVLVGVAAWLAGCSSDSSSSYTQVERLGRPAINEGLVRANANLVAYNSVPPSADLSDAASAVRTDVVGTLTALGTACTAAGQTPAAVADVAAGFIPDVMRIDTAHTTPVGTAAYNNDFTYVTGVTGTSTPSGATGPVILTGGRKPADDVMDVTLSYLCSKDPTGATIQDNVSYAGFGGNAAQGHTALLSAFPYLANPR